mgnify:CR=1 FL=1|jgi:hypothetical protein
MTLAARTRPDPRGTHGKRLRGSHGACAELLRRHLFDAADFLPYVERLLAERRRAWIG